MQDESHRKRKKAEKTLQTLFVWVKAAVYSDILASDRKIYLYRCSVCGRVSGLP